MSITDTITTIAVVLRDLAVIWGPWLAVVVPLFVAPRMVRTARRNARIRQTRRAQQVAMARFPNVIDMGPRLAARRTHSA